MRMRSCGRHGSCNPQGVVLLALLPGLLCLLLVQSVPHGKSRGENKAVPSIARAARRPRKQAADSAEDVSDDKRDTQWFGETNASAAQEARAEFLQHHMHVARSILQEDPTNPCPGKAREEGTPLTIFLVLFKGRSGSSAFMSELAQHDEILVPGYEPWDHLDKLAAPRLVSGDQIRVDYMDDAIALANKHKCRAVGFKFRPVAESVRVVLRNIQRWKPRIVAQDRWNVVANAVSAYRHRVLDSPTQAGERQQRVDDSSASTTENSQVTITDWDLFDRLLRSAKAAADLLQKTGANLQAEKIYYYEQYVLDHARTMRSIFNLLGVDPEQHDPSFSADTNSISLCDRVANFQDLCAQYWCRPKDVDYHLLQDPWQDCTCSPVPKC